MMHKKETAAEKKARLLANIKFLDESAKPVSPSALIPVKAGEWEAVTMIEPSPISLSEICTPPHSWAWKLYNYMAGTIDCSCCVFWRGLILGLLTTLWIAIAIVLLLLIIKS
jgi:hypothetical protein